MLFLTCLVGLLLLKSTSEVGHKEAGVARKVTLNEKQELAVSKVVNGESIVLIGAAGTGKTTSVRQMTERLLESNSLPKLSISTKWLLQGKPGVAILSYTRKAVNNIRHAVVENLRPHVITIHKLLEYQPVYYQIEDPDNAGQFKNTMRFEPTRNSDNPLPAQLALLIHEESSMEAVDLYHLSVLLCRISTRKSSWEISSNYLQSSASLFLASR
jgi:GTPase SAR1 family protein